MIKLVFSPEFDEKYDALKKYIDIHYGEKVRRKVVRTINERIRMLKKYPSSGILLSEVSEVQTDYRYFPPIHSQNRTSGNNSGEQHEYDREQQK